MCKLCEVSSSQMRKYGKIFGYPSCCIEEFIRNKKLIKEGKEDPTNNLQKLIAQLTYGFVPCTKHAEMALSGEMSVFEMIKDRDVELANKLNEENPD